MNTKVTKIRTKYIVHTICKICVKERKRAIKPRLKNGEKGSGDKFFMVYMGQFGGRGKMVLPEWRLNIMANLFSILFIILVAIVGGIPTIVITGYIPVMIAQKIYRKVKFGYSLYQ